ncbi:hypothetical protein ACLB2K_055971 [Fragaria x ananassa]
MTKIAYNFRSDHDDPVIHGGARADDIGGAHGGEKTTLINTTIPAWPPRPYPTGAACSLMDSILTQVRAVSMSRVFSLTVISSVLMAISSRAVNRFEWCG